MIYLDCNMEPYISYTLASTRDYNTIGRNNLLNGTSINHSINELITFLENLYTDNLVDRGIMALSPMEVIHLQNMPLRNHDVTNNEDVIMLDVEDISDEINIIDNLTVGAIKVIMLKRYDIDNYYRFSILDHKEQVFDDILPFYTIFLSSGFINTDNLNERILKLIFTCVDYFVTNASTVTSDIFCQHPISVEDGYTDNVNLSPRTIFRNRLSTSELLFITDYFVFMCYYMNKWFNVTQEEIREQFLKFPLFDLIGSDTLDNILDNIYHSIANYKNQNDELKFILNSEYKVAEYLRDSIMNKSYEE